MLRRSADGQMPPRKEGADVRVKEAQEDYLPEGRPVATPQPWTGEELSRLPEGWRYEIDEGELVIMAPAGFEHADIGATVTGLIWQFVHSHGLGKVLTCEPGFRLRRDPEILRTPDVAFISNERVALIADPEKFSDVPPDLAVEVLSPSNAGMDMGRKIEQYLAAGVRSVWVLDPRARILTVYRSGEPPVVLNDLDATVEDTCLPGFRCRLAELLG